MSNEKYEEQALLDFAWGLLMSIGNPEWETPHGGIRRLRCDIAGHWIVEKLQPDNSPRVGSWQHQYTIDIDIAARFIRDYLREKLEEKGVQITKAISGGYQVFRQGDWRGWIVLKKDLKWSTRHAGGFDRAIKFNSLEEALIKTCRVVLMGGE